VNRPAAQSSRAWVISSAVRATRFHHITSCSRNGSPPMTKNRARPRAGDCSPWYSPMTTVTVAPGWRTHRQPGVVGEARVGEPAAVRQRDPQLQPMQHRATPLGGSCRRAGPPAGPDVQEFLARRTGVAPAAEAMEAADVLAAGERARMAPTPPRWTGGWRSALPIWTSGPRQRSIGKQLPVVAQNAVYWPDAHRPPVFGEHVTRLRS